MAGTSSDLYEPEAQVHEYLMRSLPVDEMVRALRSWRWLGAESLRPGGATMFGDLILEGHGGWWFLSTLEGTLTRPWATKDECEAALLSDDGMQDYLGAGLVDLAYSSGLQLEPGEAIGFQVPPLLGGGFDLDNLRATRFSVVHLFMGQLHEHMAALGEADVASDTDVAADASQASSGAGGPADAVSPPDALFPTDRSAAADAVLSPVPGTA